MKLGFTRAPEKLLWCLLVLGLLFASGTAQAEHFDIKLTASSGAQALREAYADQDPPAGGLNPRPVLKVRAGERINFQFVMTNVYPHGQARSAAVHYYVAREKDLGQKTTPSLETPVIEGRFTLDLKPKASIGVREQLVIRQPGSYLLRVESLRTQRDHEHFSAIDLEVK
jgi:hypothetical protein